MGIEIQPWCHFDTANKVSLLKMARLLRGVDPSDNSPLFGTIGKAIAAEIESYCTCNDGKAKRRPRTSKEKPEHAWEVGMLGHFSSVCNMTTGSPAIIDYGRDRKLLRKVWESGNGPKFIEEMIDYFFGLKDNPYIFRNGTVKDFCNSFTAIVVQYNKSKEEDKPSVPIGVGE